MARSVVILDVDIPRSRGSASVRELKEKIMTDQKTPQPKDAGKKPEKAMPKSAALSPDDLDKVSGGINPQPLPPMRRVSQ